MRNQATIGHQEPRSNQTSATEQQSNISNEATIEHEQRSNNQTSGTTQYEKRNALLNKMQ
jgi:hypothetical protein